MKARIHDRCSCPVHELRTRNLQEGAFHERVSTAASAEVFPESNGGIADQWLGPEADAENKPKCDVKKSHATPQSKPVADAPDDHRDYRSADDRCAQYPRERAVVLSDRVERERNHNRPHYRREQANQRESNQRRMRRPQQSRGKTEQRANASANQNLAAIK